VRDRLLGHVSKDRDWVVVGETPETMLAAGFEQVGADFPVFLHPETREEHALARTERKVGSGYLGFETAHGPEVTLEEDLRRRDLTINAMAMDADGTLVDPYGGAADLRAGVLRAVSEAFAEDPLRVLRVARFAARYGFEVEEGTRRMCTRISRLDEFATLSADRVGVETLKALGEPGPDRYFRFLADIGALGVHYPEIAALAGQAQPVAHHPEGDAFEHTMLVLRRAAVEDLPPSARFGALVHDLGKGLTPKDRLPRHHGHEQAGVPLVDAMCRRLRLSNELARAGRIAAEWHTHVHRIGEMKPSTVARLADALDVRHHPDNAVLLEQVSRCDARGRLGHEDDPYPQGARFLAAMEAAASVRFRDSFTPAEIAAMSVEARKTALARITAAAIRERLRAPADDTPFTPGITVVHGEEVYHDGAVRGVVQTYDLPDGRHGLSILEWSSLSEKGNGHTTRALEWLRERYAQICADGIGMVDPDGEQGPARGSVSYWRHMQSKGLVDILLDDEGNVVQPLQDTTPVP